MNHKPFTKKTQTPKKKKQKKLHKRKLDNTVRKQCRRVVPDDHKH